MVDMQTIERLAQEYNVPIEDALFISLNVNGVDFACDYNRMRMAFRLSNDTRFAYATQRKEREYYFALPITPSSSFSIREDGLLRLHDTVIGEAIGPTEDICDSHYPRRNGTSININPNSRTSCRGCDFCYTAYQVPYDKQRLETARDIHDFFDDWLEAENKQDLSHLLQVSVVTGCYPTSEELCDFLETLKDVLNEYAFQGRIFYLGSQLNTFEHLERLERLRPFGICYSLETFGRRELLKNTKRMLTLDRVVQLMDAARELEFEVNFSYIVGMEPLHVMEYHFRNLMQHINKFPTINTLQLHKYHKGTIMDPDAKHLAYFLEARKILEQIFAYTPMRPLVWEDYRSLWFLTFNGEPLHGIRTP